MCGQGKKGEMIITGLISSMGQLDRSLVDFERYSTTNTADNGIDLCVHHTEGNFKEMIEISEGDRSKFSNPLEDASQKILTRIDVKTHSGKITSPVMRKFVSDIPKSPKIKGHLLMGGQGLTRGAEKLLQDAKERYSNNMVAYISESGIENLLEATKLQLEDENNKE